MRISNSSVALAGALALFLAVPAHAQQLVPFRDFVVPQIAVGGGYETKIVLSNHGTVRYDGTVTFARLSNQAFPVSVNGSAPQSVFSFDVLAGETFVMNITADGPVQTGFARWVANSTSVRDLRSSLEMSVTYRLAEAGSTRDAVGVIPPTELRRFFIHYQRSATEDAGLALVNLDPSQSVTATLRLFDATGVVRDTRTLLLQPLSHSAKFISELMAAPLLIDGRVEVDATGPIAAVALRSQDGQLSALPVTASTEIWEITIAAGFTRQFRVILTRDGFHQTAAVAFLPSSNPSDTELYVGSGRVIDREWTLSFRSASPFLRQTVNYHLVSPTFGIVPDTFSGTVVYYIDGAQFVTGIFSARRIN
ncbi:MAG: hypothetical protein ACR2L2_03805 [Acidobacteriota bacterium]